jgi:hypothetical protein
MRIPLIKERNIWMFGFPWIIWHWGLLAFGLLPYPEPRLTVMKLALGIDALCFIYFIYWTFMLIHGKVERIPRSTTRRSSQ